MDKLRRVLTGNDQNDEENRIIGNLDDVSTLSWSTRIKGFCICFIVGILLSIVASLTLFISFNLKTFAIFYTLGNILSMTSTCFLMGPVKQFKKMFASTRYIATIIVIISLVFTLIAALWLKKAGLALIFVIIQSLAMTWYSLSYIPYARDAVKKTLEAIVV